MFKAFNKSTNLKIQSIDTNYTEQFFKNEIWYLDPLYIEECPEGIDKNKIEVKWRLGSDNIINKFGTIYDILPHFYIPNLEKIGLKIKKENKTHEKCVNFIYSLVKEDKIKLIISKKTKLKEEKNNVYELIKTNIDISNSEVEVRIQSRNYKIADILIPLKKYDDVLGFGIIIEIQLTEQKNYYELERSFQRANKGYSVCWLKPEDFIDINADRLELINKEIKIENYNEILKKYKESCIDEIKELTINYRLMLDEKNKEFKTMFDKNYDELLEIYNMVKSLSKSNKPNLECPKCHKEKSFVYKEFTSRAGNECKQYKCIYCGEMRYV